jgi:hypothetical protein
MSKIIHPKKPTKNIQTLKLNLISQSRKTTSTMHQLVKAPLKASKAEENKRFPFSAKSKPSKSVHMKVLNQAIKDLNRVKTNKNLNTITRKISICQILANSSQITTSQSL